MIRRLTPIAVAALLIAGCSGDDTPPVESVDAPTTVAATEEPEPTAEPEPEPEPEPTAPSAGWGFFADEMKIEVLSARDLVTDGERDCSMLYTEGFCAGQWQEFDEAMADIQHAWDAHDAAVTAGDAPLKEGVDAALKEYGDLKSERDASCSTDDTVRCTLDSMALHNQSIEIAEAMHMWADPDYSRE